MLRSPGASISALFIRFILFTVKTLLWPIIEPVLLLDTFLFIHARSRRFSLGSNLYLRGAIAVLILLIGSFAIFSPPPTLSLAHVEPKTPSAQLQIKTPTIRTTVTALKRSRLEVKNDTISAPKYPIKKSSTVKAIPPVLSSASKGVGVKAKSEPAKIGRKTFAGLFASGKFVNISSGNPALKEISITFDGGYEANHAMEILRVLKEKKIKTTFFITGMFILDYPDIVKAILRDGHEIANHTMDHPHLTDYADTRRQVTLKNITRKFIVDELRSTAALYKELTGEEISVFWRAPFGEINRQISRWAYEEGFIHVGWTMDYKSRKNLDSLDWVSDVNSRYYLSPEEIKNKIMDFDNFSTGLGGGIILMHLGSSRDKDRAVQVLASLIDEIRSRHYRFVKVSRLARSRLNPKAVTAGRLASMDTHTGLVR